MVFHLHDREIFLIVAKLSSHFESDLILETFVVCLCYPDKNMKCVDRDDYFACMGYEFDVAFPMKARCVHENDTFLRLHCGAK